MIAARKELGAKLIVRTVDEAIAKGIAHPAPGEISRNKLQIPVLLGAIEEFQFDCAIGGARRDEEKARAKERFFSFRDSFGQWDPKAQRPENLESLQRPRKSRRKHARVSALELDRNGCLGIHQKRKARRADDLFQPRARMFSSRRTMAAGADAAHRFDEARSLRGRASEAERTDQKAHCSRAHDCRHDQHRHDRIARRQRG